MDLQFRYATKDQGDVEFILRAFDTAVEFLQSIGSDQWGREAFSKRPRAVAAVEELVRKGEEELEGDAYVRCFIAQRLAAASQQAEALPIRCGAAIIDAAFPEYVRVVPDLHPHVAASSSAKDFFYLDRLIADRSLGALSKGVGRALLDHCKQVSRSAGKRYLYTDCFAGPPTALAQFYQAQGFQPLGPFTVPGKHVDGSAWPGLLLRCDLEATPA